MKSLASGYHLAVDEGEAYDFLSTLSIVKARGAATNNALGVVEMRLPAGLSPPPHIHHNEDEAFYLLSGRIEAQLGEQKIPAEQGAFLWLPRNVLHGFVVSADGPLYDPHHHDARGIRRLRGGGGDAHHLDRDAGTARAGHPSPHRGFRAIRDRVPASAGPFSAG